MHIMSFILFLLLNLVSCILCARSSVPNVVIIAPVEGATYILAHDQIRTSVTIEYAIQNNTQFDDIQYCFQLSRMASAALSSYPESCFMGDGQRLTLTDVEVGEYVLNSYLKNTMDVKLTDSAVNTKFSVITYESAMPQLQLHSAPMHVLDISAVSTDVSLSYTLQKSVLDVKDFLVCMWLTSDYAADGLDKTCVPSTQTDITLRGMSKGEHTFYAALQPVGATELIASSIVSMKIQVVELHTVPLSVQLVGHTAAAAQAQAEDRFILEYSVDASDPIKLSLSIQGLQSAIDKTVLCLSINSELTPEQEVPALQVFNRGSCYPVTTNEFTLRRSAPGLYAVSFYLLPVEPKTVDGAPNEALAQLLRRPVGRVVQARVEVREQEEFVPSYDWRPLKPWHSIPAGLETRLPVGTRGGAIKEARIPYNWRLQLPLPSPPCRYFLRMDLTRHSTIRDIMAQASVQCKQPQNCFLVYADDSLLGSEITVEACDFFQRVQKIEFDPSCLP